VTVEKPEIRMVREVPVPVLDRPEGSCLNADMELTRSLHNGRAVDRSATTRLNSRRRTALPTVSTSTGTPVNRCTCHRSGKRALSNELPTYTKWPVHCF